jgi:Major Facilitator Superfamily
VSAASPAVAAASTPTPRSVRFRQLGLVVVFITSLMLVIDNNSVIVALPDMPRSLHFSPANLSFVVTGYALSFAGFILLSGKVGSIIGAKRALTIGTPVFIGPFAAGGFAPNPSVLITARVVQRVGGAIAAPSTGIARGQHRVRSATHPRPRLVRLVEGERSSDRADPARSADHQFRLALGHVRQRPRRSAGAPPVTLRKPMRRSFHLRLSRKASTSQQCAATPAGRARLVAGGPTAGRPAPVCPSMPEEVD